MVSIAAWGCREKFINQPNFAFKMFAVVPHSGQLDIISELIAKGKFQAPELTVLPLSEAEKAIEMSRTGRTRGKIVLKCVE